MKLRLRALYAFHCPRCDRLVPVGGEFAKRGGKWLCLACAGEGRE